MARTIFQIQLHPSAKKLDLLSIPIAWSSLSFDGGFEVHPKCQRFPRPFLHQYLPPDVYCLNSTSMSELEAWHQKLLKATPELFYKFSNVRVIEGQLHPRELKSGWSLQCLREANARETTQVYREF